VEASTLDVSGLDGGLYILELRNSSGNRKFIVSIMNNN
jgi:hypothetical protein